MSVGLKIKKLRELKNYTQAYMAQKLKLSLSGYGKIERDETDITLKRLKEIASILETDYSNILNFDEKNIFNITHNKTANGVVQNQQVNNAEGWQKLVLQLKEENRFLRGIVEKHTK